MPELAGEFAQMGDLFGRKLWHQLTKAIEAFVALPAAGAVLQALYETFVTDFKHRLNKLALARIQVAVARQMPEVSQQSFFCKMCAEELGSEERMAKTLIQCELARMLLDASQPDDAKEQLDLAAAYLDAAAGVDPEVQASYYKAWAAYYKIKGPAAQFYKHALLLLAYSSLSAMPADEALTISFDLGIAALVGEGLYNFGELLEHPVVATLEATEFAWLADLLRAFNAGDIAQYEALVTSHHAKLEQQPALLANTTFLKEKITLMALTETSSSGSAAAERTTFGEIASATKLPVEQVELLVMRALSSSSAARSTRSRDRPRAVGATSVLQQPQMTLMKSASARGAAPSARRSPSRTRRPSSPPEAPHRPPRPRRQRRLPERARRRRERALGRGTRRAP